jgi:hypothetical protein
MGHLAVFGLQQKLILGGENGIPMVKEHPPIGRSSHLARNNHDKTKILNKLYNQLPSGKLT